MNKIEINENCKLSYENEKIVVEAAFTSGGHLYDIILEKKGFDLSQREAHRLPDLAARIQDIWKKQFEEQTGAPEATVYEWDPLKKVGLLNGRVSMSKDLTSDMQELNRIVAETKVWEIPSNNNSEINEDESGILQPEPMPSPISSRPSKALSSPPKPVASSAIPQELESPSKSEMDQCFNEAIDMYIQDCLNERDPKKYTLLKQKFFLQLLPDLKKAEGGDETSSNKFLQFLTIYVKTVRKNTRFESPFFSTLIAEDLKARLDFFAIKELSTNLDSLLRECSFEDEGDFVDFLQRKINLIN